MQSRGANPYLPKSPKLLVQQTSNSIVLFANWTSGASLHLPHDHDRKSSNRGLHEIGHLLGESNCSDFWVSPERLYALDDVESCVLKHGQIVRCQMDIVPD